MHTRELLLANRQPQTTIGVLTERELLLLDLFTGGKRALRSLLLPLDAAEPGVLLPFLWQAEPRVVWVMPATRWSQSLSHPWFTSAESLWTVIVRPASHSPDRPLSVLLWPTGSLQPTARRLAFAFPEHAGWGWQLTDATSVLATVTYLERVLARPVSDGPELLAHQLLADLTATSSSTLERRSSPVDQTHYNEPADASFPSSEEQISDLAWMRPLTRVEQQHKYLHHYTHLSYRLEACLHVQLPAGTPAYSSTGRAYDGSRPGLWRVKAERAGSVFDGKQLPSCLDCEWMSTPQVQCCRGIGYQVQVCEGSFWSQAQKPLQPWALALWQAAERVQTSPLLFKHALGRANTASSIKLLAQLGMVSLSHQQREDGWFRPACWAHIVGGSRATLFAHLVRLVKRGTMPVLVNGDALWVVSDDPHPLTAVPGLLDGRRWSGYSAGNAIPLPLSREVREIFTTANSPMQAAMCLDTLAHEASSTS